MLGQPRSTQRYLRRESAMERQLLAEMRRLTAECPRFGCERIHDLLIKTGWQANFKRVHRLWKREQMQVPQKQKRKRRLSGSSENGCTRHRAEHINHVWSYDFLTDLKLLVILDEYSRESLAIEVDRSLTSREVIDVLLYLLSVRGAPRYIRSGNGPEFVAQAVQKWLSQAGVETLFIAKGSPWENGYIESFNGKLRDELLHREIFLSLTEARWVIDRWRMDYNRRPHSSLVYHGENLSFHSQVQSALSLGRFSQQAGKLSGHRVQGGGF